MFQVGYLTLFRLGGTPVRMHWSAPVAALLFGGLGLRPWLWLGFLLLILVHEVGHLTLIWRRGLAPATVDLHGLGGLCLYSEVPSTLDHAVVAWGGVLAQATLGAATVAAVLVFGEPTDEIGAELVHAFTWSNLVLAGLNLLPFAPLDGHQAWRIFRARRRSHRDPAHAPPGAGAAAKVGEGAQERRSPGDPPPGRPRRSHVDMEEGVAVIDGDEVRSTVQRALEDAAREATKRRRDRSED